MKAFTMTTSHRAGVCFLSLALGLILGCSPRKDNAPPSSQVHDALTATLPPYLTMSTVETESIPTGPDQAKVNCKVTVSPKETLYAPDRRVPGDPSILLIKTVQAADGKVTLYGSLQAQRTLDRWTLAAPVFPDGFEQLGRPRSAFGAQCFVTNTPEAAAAIKALNDHADEQERQMKDRQEKERQAQQAETEQTQREEQAAKDRLLRATAPGTRYLGTLTDPSTAVSQRLRLTFTEQQGLLVRAEATNPDQPADRRSLSGELVPEAKRIDAPYATKSYPIQLSATGGQQAAAKGRWNFYCHQGPLSLVPDDQGGLEGEAVIFQRYVVHLQREP